MIIIGYPGIGKSTLARKEDFKIPHRRGLIDLESSNFNTSKYFAGKTTWCEIYCNVALDLSLQGYDVFVSSHADVYDMLLNDIYTSRAIIGAIIPDISLKKAWLQKLFERYLTSNEEKDKRAFDRALSHFENDIHQLENAFDFTHHIKNGVDRDIYLKKITTMEYSLEDFIISIYSEFDGKYSNT